MYNLFAQTDSSNYITIRNISVEENKRTKDYIILNKMSLKEGDKVLAKDLDSTILSNRLEIYNFKLFKDVNFNIKNWENDSLDLVIKAYDKKWTAIPVPIIKFADRNVNEWWKLYNHDFGRLQYGLRVNWSNTSGRNDFVTVAFSYGFAQMLDFTYFLPYFKNKPKLGLMTDFMMMRSRRTAYTTRNDELQYLTISKTFHNTNIKFEPSIFFNQDKYTNHILTAGYGYTKVSDSVIHANPNYFINDKNNQHYFKIAYNFVADHRNVKAYPTDGWLLQFGIQNYGLGFMKDVKMTNIYFRLSKYNEWEKHKRFSVANYGKFLISFKDKQPYNLQSVKSLGYGDNLVRGYELNVLDGQHYLLFKTEQRFKAVDFKFINAKKFKNKAIINKAMAYLPINLVIKTYFDAAYVWDNQFEATNQLKNKWIFGFGAGIDLITFNFSVVRFEYSFNRNLENRLYLHFIQAL
ncbi:MAG: BamA/TamA family outer membrane protein [Chitinophagales bacterium]|nr:BamA/TamA family outer membrane protein [Chitinophagales bacterium]